LTLLLYSKMLLVIR